MLGVESKHGRQAARKIVSSICLLANRFGHLPEGGVIFDSHRVYDVGAERASHEHPPKNVKFGTFNILQEWEGLK